MAEIPEDPTAVSSASDGTRLDDSHHDRSSTKRSDASKDDHAKIEDSEAASSSDIADSNKREQRIQNDSSNALHIDSKSSSSKNSKEIPEISNVRGDVSSNKRTRSNRSPCRKSSSDSQRKANEKDKKHLSDDNTSSKRHDSAYALLNSSRSRRSNSRSKLGSKDERNQSRCSPHRQSRRSRSKSRPKIVDHRWPPKSSSPSKRSNDVSRSRKSRSRSGPRIVDQRWPRKSRSTSRQRNDVSRSRKSRSRSGPRITDRPRGHSSRSPPNRNNDVSRSRKSRSRSGPRITDRPRGHSSRSPPNRNNDVSRSRKSRSRSGPRITDRPRGHSSRSPPNRNNDVSRSRKSRSRSGPRITDRPRGHSSRSPPNRNNDVSRSRKSRSRSGPRITDRPRGHSSRSPPNRNNDVSRSRKSRSRSGPRITDRPRGHSSRSPPNRNNDVSRSRKSRSRSGPRITDRPRGHSSRSPPNRSNNKRLDQRSRSRCGSRMYNHRRRHSSRSPPKQSIDKKTSSASYSDSQARRAVKGERVASRSRSRKKESKYMSPNSRTHRSKSRRSRSINAAHDRRSHEPHRTSHSASKSHRRGRSRSISPKNQSPLWHGNLDYDINQMLNGSEKEVQNHYLARNCNASLSVENLKQVDLLKQSLNAREELDTVLATIMRRMDALRSEAIIVNEKLRYGEEHGLGLEDDYQYLLQLKDEFQQLSAQADGIEAIIRQLTEQASLGNAPSEVVHEEYDVQHHLERDQMNQQLSSVTHHLQQCDRNSYGSPITGSRGMEGEGQHCNRNSLVNRGPSATRETSRVVHPLPPVSFGYPIESSQYHTVPVQGESKVYQHLSLDREVSAPMKMDSPAHGRELSSPDSNCVELEWPSSPCQPTTSAGREGCLSPISQQMAEYTKSQKQSVRLFAIRRAQMLYAERTSVLGPSVSEISSLIGGNTMISSERSSFRALAGSMKMNRDAAVDWTQRSIEDFKLLELMGKGKQFEVLKALDSKAQSVVVLRSVCADEANDGFRRPALRVIKMLSQLVHPNIVKLLEVIRGRPEPAVPVYSKFYLSFEYLAYDLATLMRVNNMTFPPKHIYYVFHQLLQGLAYCHRNNIVHCDIRPCNVLISAKGEVKLSYFCGAHWISDLIGDTSKLSPESLYYRAPELMLGAERWSTAMDMWSAGCILGEMIRNSILFTGSDEFQVMMAISELCGSPSVAVWPDVAKLPKFYLFANRPQLPRRISAELTGQPTELVMLLDKLLTLNPGLRMQAEAAVQDPKGSKITAPSSFVEALESLSVSHTAKANMGFRSLENFEVLSTVSTGSFGLMYRALDHISNSLVILRTVGGQEGVTAESQNMISSLRSLTHPNIIRFNEVIRDSGNKFKTQYVFYVSLEDAPHSLGGLLQTAGSGCLTLQHIVCLFNQLLKAVVHCHAKNVVHCDIRPANILITLQGEVKLSAFSYSCTSGSTADTSVLPSESLLYRSPELLLGADKFVPSADMWSCGCVLGEMIQRKPLFGVCTDEMQQLCAISALCGTPSAVVWPEVVNLPRYATVKNQAKCARRLQSEFGSSIPTDAVDLLNGLLTLNPSRRTAAQTALSCAWVKNVNVELVSSTLPLPKSQEPLSLKRSLESTTSSDPKSTTSATPTDSKFVVESAKQEKGADVATVADTQKEKPMSVVDVVQQALNFLLTVSSKNEDKVDRQVDALTSSVAGYTMSTLSTNSGLAKTVDTVKEPVTSVVQAGPTPPKKIGFMKVIDHKNKPINALSEKAIPPPLEQPDEGRNLVGGDLDRQQLLLPSSSMSRDEMSDDLSHRETLDFTDRAVGPKKTAADREAGIAGTVHLTRKGDGDDLLLTGKNSLSYGQSLADDRRVQAGSGGNLAASGVLPVEQPEGSRATEDRADSIDLGSMEHYVMAQLSRYRHDLSTDDRPTSSSESSAAAAAAAAKRDPYQRPNQRLVLLPDRSLVDNDEDARALLVLRQQQRQQQQQQQQRREGGAYSPTVVVPSIEEDDVRHVNTSRQRTLVMTLDNDRFRHGRGYDDDSQRDYHRRQSSSIDFEFPPAAAAAAVGVGVGATRPPFAGRHPSDFDFASTGGRRGVDRWLVPDRMHFGDGVELPHRRAAFYGGIRPPSSRFPAGDIYGVPRMDDRSFLSFRPALPRTGDCYRDWPSSGPRYFP